VLGWDLPQLHAAVNDLPAALLLMAVLFEFLALINRRESLHAAAFWMLLTGSIGAIAAVATGIAAEEGAALSGPAHDLLERHETLAFVVLGVFAPLTVWRLVRRAMQGTERTIYLTLAMVGVVLLVATSKIGGSLVFDHAAGIPDATLRAVQLERGTDTTRAGPETAH
jgi:uncharacterized membrane protein